jgi:hypothetical protein
MAEAGVDMRQLLKRLAAWWDETGYVRWHLPLGGGWQISGRFSNCVSQKCLIGRVKQIVETPREPPRRVHRLADVALDYLVGIINDVELDSYEVRLGVNSGIEDRRDKALADLIIAKLTGGAVATRPANNDDENSNDRFPDIFLGIRLSYDAYDCPDSDEMCEGWWLEVTAEYNIESEWCSAEWSRYAGTDKRIDVDAVLRTAYKALRHAYNASQ